MLDSLARALVVALVIIGLAWVTSPWWRPWLWPAPDWICWTDYGGRWCWHQRQF
jgi:hypothetical protein